MRRPPVTLGLVLVVVLTGAGIGLDRNLAAPTTATAPEPRSGPATAGAWYCAVGDTAEGRSLRVSAAAPDRGVSTPATVTRAVYSEGEVDVDAPTRIFPGSADSEPVSDGRESPGVTVRWSDAPVAVARSWMAGGDETDELPAGRISGPCEPAPSDRWIVPGMATAGGAEAFVVLANPFTSGASVSVSFTTADGRLEPQLLRNVVVPAQSTREVAVNDFAPQRTDLGVVVEARSGRVVTEAYQVLNAAIGGVDAVTLTKATPTASEVWTLPWVKVDDTTGSWLWISNTDDRPAALTLSVHTADGAEVPEGLQSVSVAPGTVRRVALAGVLPEGEEGAGITVRSDNGVAVAVSAATQVTADEPERSGLAVQLGARAPDEGWVLHGGAAEGRTEQVNLVNPGGEPAQVDLAVWTGARVVRPDALQDVAVPAGGRTVVPVDVGATDSHTVFVSGEVGAVVAGLTSMATEGPLALVASLGVPTSVWSGGQPVPAVDHVPGLAQRLGTTGGVVAPDPTAVPTGTDSPSPPDTSPSPVPTPSPGTTP